MNKFKQNIIYAIILVTVIGFFWLTIPQDSISVKGIYLPQNSKNFSSIQQKRVEFYSTDNINIYTSLPQFSELSLEPIAIIRVNKYYNSINDIPNTCQDTITEAKRLAANNGANKIIGSCFISDKNGPFKSVTLSAYAYSFQ